MNHKVMYASYTFEMWWDYQETHFYTFTAESAGEDIFLKNRCMHVGKVKGERWIVSRTLCAWSPQRWNERRLEYSDKQLPLTVMSTWLAQLLSNWCKSISTWWLAPSATNWTLVMASKGRFLWRLIPQVSIIDNSVRGCAVSTLWTYFVSRGVVVRERGGTPFRQIFWSWNGAPANIVGHRWNANTEAFRQITSYSLGCPSISLFSGPNCPQTRNLASKISKKISGGDNPGSPQREGETPSRTHPLHSYTPCAGAHAPPLLGPRSRKPFP